MVAARVTEQNALASGMALLSSVALDDAGFSPDLAETCQRAD